LFSDELTGEFGKDLENASVDDFGLLGPFAGKGVALHFRSFATISAKSFLRMSTLGGKRAFGQTAVSAKCYGVAPATSRSPDFSFRLLQPAQGTVRFTRRG
jgi:hypothetical protein